MVTAEQIGRWFEEHRARLERFAVTRGAAAGVGFDKSKPPAGDVVAEAAVIALARAAEIRGVSALNAYFTATIRRLLANSRRINTGRRRIAWENPLVFDKRRLAEAAGLEEHEFDPDNEFPLVEDFERIYDPTKPSPGRPTRRATTDDDPNYMA